MDITAKNSAIRQLLWIGMIGITMFFAGLTSAVIVRSAESGWVKIGIPDFFWLSTCSIIIGSILMIIAKRNIKQDKPVTQYVIATLIFGLFFALFQFLGWKDLVSNEIYFTGKNSTSSSSFLYVITLAHLLHVIGGLISLIFTSVKSYKGKYNRDDYLGIELASIYWHFLDALWIYLLIFLFYMLN